MSQGDKPRIFAVGDLNVDIFTFSSGGFIFGQEQSAKSLSYSVGGNAANFAIAAAGLGCDVSLVCAVGSDIFTSYLLAALKKYAVRPLLLHGKGMNGISNILVRGDGERAIISRNGVMLSLDCNFISRKILPLVKKGDIVFFGGYYHLSGMKKGFAKLIKKIRVKGAKVFFDTTFDEHGRFEIRPFAKLIDLLFINQEELGRVSGKKTIVKAINWLHSAGINEVVLKEGRDGASCFCGGASFHAPALGIIAKNTTGAGDYFNAGFVWARANGFGAANCLAAGNFVAGKKVSHAGYYVPPGKMLEDYVASGNIVAVEKVAGYNALSKRAASLIVRALQENPYCVLCLCAGKTPLGTYRELVKAYRRREADFSRATFIELDEYMGKIRKNEGFGHMLLKKFIEKVNFREKNVFLFDSASENFENECRKFRSLVARKGIGFLLLGIGENGHIAFNEPGTSFGSGVHLQPVSQGLLKSRGQYFSSVFPAYAITLGVKEIMASKKIVLVASGKKKAKAVAKALNKGVSQNVPASVLQRHPDATFILDRAAAGSVHAGKQRDAEACQQI